MDHKTKKIQRDQDSYEAKLKRRDFKPDGSQKYDFGSEYRDLRTRSPSALDEAYEVKKLPNYPAAPLPFVANKSFGNTEIVTRSLKTSPTTTEAPFLEGQYMTPDLKFKPQPHGHARQSFNSDTPTSVKAEPPSSPPSSNDFTKARMAKITDRDGYRLSTGDSYLSDQEKETDDEHATESDLETHAGDDDSNYAANPEEEDEGYDSLQSQFKNVRIHKRPRDDVDDAEHDDEADAAQLEGDGKQRTRKMHLTEEEGVHRGKKSRTARTSSAADGGQDAHGIEKT